MKRPKINKIIIALVFIALMIYFWPQYQAQVPKTKEQKAKIIVSEMNQVSPQAPLELITEPDDGLAQIQNAISGASKSLDLVDYELEDSAIEKSLADANKRGVAVRVILQNINTFGKTPNQDAYDFLKNQGVPVMWAKDYFALTHQKTLIIDGTFSIIMTFNFAPKYYASGRDFAFIDKNEKDVKQIEDAFQSDWDGSEITAGNGDDLVWSPGSAETLIYLINSASKSLDVYNEEMADPRITTALEMAAKKGVAVRVDMTYSTNWKRAFNELLGAGVEIRTYSSKADLYIHAKTIIADGTKAFVGSENFSAPSLDLNRELGILISRPDIVASLENTFNKDWLSARPFIVK